MGPICSCIFGTFANAQRAASILETKSRRNTAQNSVWTIVRVTLCELRVYTQPARPRQQSPSSLHAIGTPVRSHMVQQYKTSDAFLWVLTDTTQQHVCMHVVARTARTARTARSPVPPVPPARPPVPPVPPGRPVARSPAKCLKALGKSAKSCGKYIIYINHPGVDMP